MSVTFDLTTTNMSQNASKYNRFIRHRLKHDMQAWDLDIRSWVTLAAGVSHADQAAGHHPVCTPAVPQRQACVCTHSVPYRFATLCLMLVEMFRLQVRVNSGASARDFNTVHERSSFQHESLKHASVNSCDVRRNNDVCTCYRVEGPVRAGQSEGVHRHHQD